MKVVGTSLVTLFATPAKAEDMSVVDIFQAAVQANPDYALSVSYAIGQTAPVVMTAGPTVTRGSVKVANNARWHIGSISKSFTATLVMRLVDSGALSLDAPIGQYLDAYIDGMHPDWTAITLRQLLSHTAGLPANASHQTMNATRNAAPYEGRRAVLSTLWDSPLDGKKGDFLYSNIGYVMAGLIIEETLGTSWEQAIISEIGIPLGLSTVGFGAPTQSDDARGHRSFLRFRNPVQPENPASDNPKWMGPAGTIHLSMADLTRWGQMHLEACTGQRPDYLSQVSCQAMQTPVSSEYGLGWVVQQTDTTGSVVWHNGSNTMWYSVLLMAPESEIVVAVATNTYAPARIDQLVKDLSGALVSAPN